MTQVNARRDRSRRHATQLRLLAGGALLAMALGFLGSLAGPLDSLSHFRAHLAVGLALLLPLLAIRRLWVSAALCLAALGAAAAGVLPFLSPPPANGPLAGPSYSLLQMNLRWNAPDPIEAIRRIAEARPDIVTLQEMTPQWRAALAPIAQTYPHQLHCEGADGFFGDSALLSRRPFVAGTEPVCNGRNSLAAARVDFNGTAVTIVSHHQLWPWPAGQWRRLERIEPTLQALPGPLLIAGDFNAAPWSALLARYAQATRTMVLGGIGPTWLFDRLPGEWARWAGLPIDHVLTSPEIDVRHVERMPATTSDHLPVLVRFTLRRPAEAPAVEIVRR